MSIHARKLAAAAVVKACLLGSAALSAEDSALDLSLTHRSRYEFVENTFRRGQPDGDEAYLLRTLAAAKWHASDTWSVKLEMQDSRSYFEEPGTRLSTSFVNTFTILEANVEYNLSGRFGSGSKGYVRFGRFTRDIGSRRTFARNGYRNTINAFTGFDSSITTDNGHNWSFILALPITRLPRDREALGNNDHAFDREDNDRLTWGAYHQRPVQTLKSVLDLYVFGLHERDDPADNQNTLNRQLVTPGFRLRKGGRKGELDWDFETMLQFGSSRATTDPSDTRDLDVFGRFFHAELGYTFDHPWNWRIALQYDSSSGEDNPQNGVFERFDTIFGVRRRDYNNTSLFGPHGRDNQEAAGVRLEFKHDNKRFDGRIHFLVSHLESATDRWRQARLVDPTGASGSYIGTNVDSRLRYWIVPKKVRFEVGASILFKGRFTLTAPGAVANTDDTYYGYSQLTFSL